MSFRPMLRPGQGFQKFMVYRREGSVTASGRARSTSLKLHGEIIGIISQASPQEIAQAKQLGSPITHTIVQRGTKYRAKANDVFLIPPDSAQNVPDVLNVSEPGDTTNPNQGRRFVVRGDPKDPGELGHFLIYRVEERDDIK